MNNASKIDTNWTKIFNKYPILQTIKDEGKYIITAQQIKEFWEPRLMTKHDHSVNRPQIFIDNSLSILPITRGSYIIGAMDLYHDFALSDREKVFDSVQIVCLFLHLHLLSLLILIISQVRLRLLIAYMFRIFSGIS